MYEERVSKSRIAREPGTAPDGVQARPRGHAPDARAALRAVATAMWYVMGTMGQADAQEELKAALYDLYEKHGKPVDGLRDELGDRD